jgi:hypothetical protein
MKEGQIDPALKMYEKEVTSDKDKLLRLMDEGMLLRVGKKFEESNQRFLTAARLIEQSGYLSLAEQTVTLVSNEKQTTYQGEDFEKVLIHLYLGLNFLSLKNTEAALVESRRVNEILYKMISEAKRPYELNAFAKYLGGVLFEADKDDNNAFVSYQSVLKIDPDLVAKFPTIQLDLMRVAARQGMSEELEELKTKFGKEEWARAKKTLEERDGSVVFLYENGKSPQKYSSREHRVTQGRGGTAVEVLIPVAYYQKRSFLIHSALVEAEKPNTAVSVGAAKTSVLNSIERTAVQHLSDRMGRAIAKALLTAGVKAGIATGIGKATNSSDLGMLAGIALFLASEADTRSWLLLPADLQVAKLFLPAGKYNLRIFYRDAEGHDVKSETIPNVEVKSNLPTFIQSRTFD